MTKCIIIGTMRIPATVGQAIRINGKKCDEETVWNVTAYGGESVVTEFYIENRSGIAFPITFDITPAIEGEYTAGIFEEDGVTPVSAPKTINGTTTVNFKFKINFDKYIAEDAYEIVIVFDFV